MKDKNIILQNSCDFLYQHGFNGSSVDALAHNADVTKKTLYRYFGSKEQLIEDSLDCRHDWFMQKLTNALNNAIGTAIIDKYLVFLKDWLTSDDFYGCMFINVCGEFSDKNHTFHQKSLDHKKQVLEMLTKKISLGKFDDNKSQQLAKLLFVNGEGLIVSMQVGIINKENIENYIDMIKFQINSI